MTTGMTVMITTGAVAAVVAVLALVVPPRGVTGVPAEGRLEAGHRRRARR